MRIRQRAYLGLASDGLDPSQITELLGTEASETKVMGSRQSGPPPLPRSHLWKLESGVSDQSPLEDHLTALWPRLADLADGLQTFTSREDSSGRLQIVRYFEEGEEDFDEATWGLPADSPFERLGGQHPFLGWRLNAVQMQFLVSVGLDLDVDEYG